MTVCRLRKCEQKADQEHLICRMEILLLRIPDSPDANRLNSGDGDHCRPCEELAIQASQGREFRISREMDEGIYCAGSEVKRGTKCRG
jgi:hypothetical protein